MRKKVIIVGAGITGMATGACLANSGFDVEIFEKQDNSGGRVSHFSSEGFHFETGPQFMMFPEIPEKFFTQFKRQLSDYLDFQAIDPIMRIYHRDQEMYDIPASPQKLNEFFRKHVKGGDRKKDRYLEKAHSFYEILLRKEVLESGRLYSKSPFEGLFPGSHLNYVRKLFRDHHLVNLLEFPYPLLGQLNPGSSAIRYAFNYSLLERGFLYPAGGMHHFSEAMNQLLDEMNVLVHISSPVESFDVIEDRVTGIITHGKNFHADYFIAATDYYSAEQLLPREYRNYSEADWQLPGSVTSSFLFYLGLDKKLKNIQANMVIYNAPEHIYASSGELSFDSLDIPVLFVACPSKLSDDLAPQGKEILVIRCIIPEGVEDNGRTREHFYEKAVRLLEIAFSQAIHEHVVYKKTQATTDVESEYGTHGGKAFGWMHIPFLKNRKNKKWQNTRLGNLFYAEYPVFVGTGVASALLSGEIIASEVMRYDLQLNS